MDDVLPATFFDVVTVRFQKIIRDPIIIFFFTQIGLNTLGVIVLVSVINQWFLLPVAILGFPFVKFRQIYLATSRSIKRLEATSKIASRILFIDI